MDSDRDLLDLCVTVLAKELPVLRKMAGLTQAELAGILGVSRQTITNIESGASRMKWPVFLAIMFVFNLDTSTSEYLKNLSIPYPELKAWLIRKKGEGV